MRLPIVDCAVRLPIARCDCRLRGAIADFQLPIADCVMRSPIARAIADFQLRGAIAVKSAIGNRHSAIS